MKKDDEENMPRVVDTQYAAPLATASELVAGSALRGPDVSDEPVEVVEEVGDPIDAMARYFVNRWVFLPHQRPAALEELRTLLLCLTEIVNADASSTANGTAATAAPLNAGCVAVNSPTQIIAARTARRSDDAADTLQRLTRPPETPMARCDSQCYGRSCALPVGHTGLHCAPDCSWTTEQACPPETP